MKYNMVYRKSKWPKISYSSIRWFTAIIIFACSLTALLTLHRHVIFYQEQHNLFLYTGDYYAHVMHWEGPLAYIGAFMIQFYYYPWLGASIVALMMSAIYLMIENIIYRIFGKRDFFQIGVACCIALYFTLDNVDETPAWLALCFICIGIIWIFVNLIFRSRDVVVLRKQLTLSQALIPISLALIFPIIGFIIEKKHYNQDERMMLMAEKAIKNRNWDKALEITDSYLATGKLNRLMYYLRHIALAEKGELVDRLFDFPQKMGTGSLAFPWRRNTRETEHGHWVHEVTGDINVAHHWAFEALTVWGETAQHLTDLGYYNVALGRPKVAIRFANRLKKSLFYRKEAEKIIRQATGEEQCQLRYVIPDSVTEVWENIMDFEPNLLQNYKSDPENEIAHQYLMASLLLKNNIQELLPLLRQDDMKHKAIREAVAIYNLFANAKPLEDFGLKYDKETQNEFYRFYDLYKKKRMRELVAKFKNTYWYYFFVLSRQTHK